MATLYTHQSKNITKTWILMGIFLGTILAIGYFLSVYYRSSQILIFAIIFSVGMNILGYWKGDKIALSLARAHPASEREYPELHRILENLAITAGLPKPALYIIPDAAPNAFATGRNSKHASVAVTKGLLDILTRSELEGVLAHELAHIGNRDILLQTIVAVLVGFIAIISDMMTHSFLWGGMHRESDENDRGGNSIFAIIGVVFIIISPIIALLIQLAISRRREYLADASGALLTRYPEGLASALEKISAHGTPLTTASNATAHMYISNPFGAKSRSGVRELFMTHPPTEKRIKALLNMKV